MDENTRTEISEEQQKIAIEAAIAARKSNGKIKGVMLVALWEDKTTSISFAVENGEPGEAKERLSELVWRTTSHAVDLANTLDRAGEEIIARRERERDPNIN